MCTSMATFYSYLLVFHCLSLVHGQLQMEINRASSLAIDDSFELPRNTTECLVIRDNPKPSCFKYRASPQRLSCWCSCFLFEARPRSLFFEPSNSCLEVSLARRRSGCDLLFTGETAHGLLPFISPIGVTQKVINVPGNNTCSFYFGKKLHAQYIGCDGDWREIPSNGVNESLEVTPGWNTSQLKLRTRDTASSFLRKNQGRIFRVAVQCRHQRKKAVAKSTCVMFKVPGRIYCPIPQQNSSKQSATLPPPTLEITSTTGFPPRPTTQAEKETTSRIKENFIAETMRPSSSA